MLKNRYLFLFFFTAFSIKKALKVIISKGCLLSSQLVITYIAITWATLYFFLNIGLMKIGVWFIMKHTTGLCSCRAWWLLAPNLCSWATRKSQIFHTNHMLGTLVLQFQSTGLPSIFLTAQPCTVSCIWPSESSLFLLTNIANTAWLHSLQQFLWKL